MTPEKLFHELLGLGLNWEVIESRFELGSGTVFLEIRETPRLWESVRCPEEGGLAFCYDHTEVLTWRHLNVFQHRCEITCRLPRGKCRQCGHVFRVRPPWEGLSTHFTKEFEAFALLLMREMPMSKVGEVVGETDTRLWRMLFRQVDAAYAEADFSNVCCVGVDEMSVRKGHEYISVFADLVRKRVLFATEGKDHQVWLDFVTALEKHNGHRHAVTQVSMDMSPAYQKGVAETCRNAQVVFDKFHVIAHANQAVDEVRRAEVRLGGAGVWEALRHSQWLWRKNPENLTENEAARLAKINQKKFAHGQGVSDATGVTGHLSERERNGGAAAVSGVVSLGAVGGAAAAQEPVALHGESGGDGGEPSGGYLGALEMGRDQCVHGGIEQRLQCDQTQGSWLPFDNPPDHHALFRGW
jgi:transposase